MAMPLVENAIENVKKQIKSLKIQLEAEELVQKHFYAKYCKLIDEDNLDEASLYTHYASKDNIITALTKEIEALELIVKTIESFDIKYYYDWKFKHEEDKIKLNEMMRRQKYFFDNMSWPKIESPKIEQKIDPETIRQRLIREIDQINENLYYTSLTRVTPNKPTQEEPKPSENKDPETKDPK